jgi:cyclopropane fatty-acyl-phospholipid synthase-like methyltransferase
MSTEPAPDHQPRNEYDENFHEQLAEFWPGPKEQLHAGGWAYTRSFIEQLKITPGQSVLDVCCGEGATACWLARTNNVRIIGVDIVPSAIGSALKRAEAMNVADRCTFVHADISELPLATATYDVVYGQDPDGFARGDRVKSFRECVRVMRAGARFGIHHWIPSTGAPADVIARFDRANADAGYPSHVNVHAEAYAEAMVDAGLSDIRVEDASAVYRTHFKAIVKHMREAGKSPSPWTSTWTELARRYPFGVAIFARRL